MGFQTIRKILAGTVLIAQAIQSQNYIAGVSGFSIASDGTVEFNDGTFRGTLTANSITNTSIGNSIVQGSQWIGGTITDPDIVLTDLGAGTILGYTITTTSVTYNVSGTFLVPVGITSLKLIQAWGAGGGAAKSAYASGGGGGEYAAEINMPVTPGETLTITIPAGGTGATIAGLTGSDGGAATVTRGANVLVRANGGQGGQIGITAIGGTGSTNAIHFPGGTSPSTSGSVHTGGSSGGSSAGTAANGVAGTLPVGLSPGIAPAAPTGGGKGGDGGFGSGGFGAGGAGVAGTAPGGGGGAGGMGGTAGNGASGAAGRIVITYQTGQTLDTSISPVAGTDAYGNTYPKGIDTVYLHADNRISGIASITPVAGVPTSVAVVFPQALTGTTFTCQVTPGTSVPGTQVTGVGYTGLTSAGVTLWITRTNNTATGLSYTVEGV